MILTFSKTFPNGEPTRFEEKITKGIKRTSIRRAGRWKKGHVIHMQSGSRFHNPKRFNPELQAANYWAIDKKASAYHTDIIDHQGQMIPEPLRSRIYKALPSPPRAHSIPETTIWPAVADTQQVWMHFIWRDGLMTATIQLDVPTAPGTSYTVNCVSHTPYLSYPIFSDRLFGEYRATKVFEDLIKADGLTTTHFFNWFADLSQTYSAYTGDILIWKGQRHRHR